MVYWVWCLNVLKLSPQTNKHIHWIQWKPTRKTMKPYRRTNPLWLYSSKHSFRFGLECPKKNIGNNRFHWSGHAYQDNIMTFGLGSRAKDGWPPSVCVYYRAKQSTTLFWMVKIDTIFFSLFSFHRNWITTTTTTRKIMKTEYQCQLSNEWLNEECGSIESNVGMLKHPDHHHHHHGRWWKIKSKSII